MSGTSIRSRVRGRHRSLVKVASGIHSVHSLKSVSSEQNHRRISSITMIGKLSQTLLDYPPVRPHSKKKQQIFKIEDYADIDSHAIKAPKGVTEDYETLVKYLTEQTDSDLARVRSIFSWLVHQHAPDLSKASSNQSSSKKVPQGPAQYLHLFHRQRRGSYAELFAKLVREANIPCVVVSGLAKSIAYEVGDPINRKKMKNKWNAVCIDGDWFLLHPYWASHSALGFNTGHWAMVDSTDWHKTNKKDSFSNLGQMAINDFYFLTDPEQFITKCFPEDQKWQLLQKPLNVGEFERCAYYQPAFYQLGLEEVGPKQCCIKTIHGKTELQFLMKKTSAHRLRFNYKLYKRRDVEDEGEYDATHLEEYVLFYKDYDHASFEMRFPIVGDFKLELFCYDKEVKLPSNWVADYKIECVKLMLRCQPFPVISSIGWGPGPKLSRVGLEATSHQKAVNCADSSHTTELCFSSTGSKSVSVKAEVLCSTVSSSELQNCVVVDQDDNGHTKVKVSPPHSGEYAVQLFAKSEDMKSYENVCNYLLRRTKPVENPVVCEKREQLDQAMAGGDQNVIQKALDELLKAGGEDRGDVKKAQRIVQVLQHTAALEKALMCGDLTQLRVARKAALEAELGEDLAELLKRAEVLMERLDRMKLLRHAVLDMSQKTISELRSYSKPPSVIHGVMAATFMLLGHKEDDVRKWRTVQVLIAKSGKKSLKRRVGTLDMKSVPEAVKERVKEILANWDMDTVHVASAGAATFYQWASSVLKEDDKAVLA